MRLRAWPVALFSIFLLAAGDREETPELPIGIEVLNVSGARIISAILPGPVADFAVLPRGEGYLVVRTVHEEEDGELLIIELGDEPELELLDVEIGTTPGRLFFGALGESLPEILLGGETMVQAISLETGESRHILERGLLERPLMARHQGSKHDVEPVSIEVGDLTRLEHSGSGLVNGPVLAIPMRAKRLATGLFLDSPSVTVMPRTESGPLYLVGPEAQGHRLRTTLLDPGAAESERVLESWARLPGPEEVQYSWYARINGRLRLIVATKRGDRMGIFEKLALRVFPLASDPTRGGRNPLLVAETETIWWNAMDIQVADVDGDQSEEMVVLQPEGLSGNDLVMQAYAKGPSTGFAVSPRQTTAKDAGSCWVYGNDVDGDHHPDLVVRRENQLLVHPGNAHRKKRSIVTKKHRGAIELPSDSSSRLVEVSVGTDGADASAHDERGCQLHLVDFDHDGRAEILAISQDRDQGRVRIIGLSEELD